MDLTPKEFDLLAHLAADPGAALTRRSILEEVWDANWYGSSKTLDVHVASLRRKLGHPEWIQAVRGVGFKLVTDAHRAAAEGRGVTRRLVLSYVLLAAFVLLVVELPLGLTYAARAQDRLLADVERDARVLAGLVEERVESGDDTAVATITEQYAAQSDGRVVVTDADGHQRRRHRPARRRAARLLHPPGDRHGAVGHAGDRHPPLRHARRGARLRGGADLVRRRAQRRGARQLPDRGGAASRSATTGCGWAC